MERQKLVKFLKICSKNKILEKGIFIHSAFVKLGLGTDLIVSNDLIDMYGKCGRMDVAHLLFDKMPEKNVISWTALMCGYLQNGEPREPLFLFYDMSTSGVRMNEFTFSIGLKASATLGICRNGAQIHVLCIKTGYETYPVVGNSTIDMYSKCGKIHEAARMFNAMPDRNLLSWNALITGYITREKGEIALSMFRKLQAHGESPDEYTFSSVLKACSNIGLIRQGRQVHASLITRGFLVSDRAIIAGGLINLYVKCRHLTDARLIFDKINQKNVILWTGIIVGHVEEGNVTEAMELFKQFEQSGIQSDSFLLSSVMGVLADFSLVEQGRQMHSYIIKIPSGLDISVANSIADMYMKCGFTEEAEKKFNEMTDKNRISWTVMITGYGKHGHGRDTTRLFEEMKANNIEPDDVTYLAILSACSHAGMIQESKKYFLDLIEDDNVEKKVEHYACMVDLLGRSGDLIGAKELIEKMPLQPTPGIWQTLLGACRIHRNLPMGREIGEILLKLDGENPANYVMLSNIYAEAEQWKDCETLRELMKTKGLRKEAGCSWIEINKEVHYFYGGDDRHPLIKKIHEVLREKEKKMKEEMGYIPGLRYAMHDVEEESKQDSLRVHSEKLALGLWLVTRGSTSDTGTDFIRIFKNLRICGDCHEFMKCLSKILKRVLVVRDANRFHKFQDGSCSCGDYW